MGREPVTYCEHCGQPFDVYRDPEDRLCDACIEDRQAELASLNDLKAVRGR